MMLAENASATSSDILFGARKCQFHSISKDILVILPSTLPLDGLPVDSEIEENEKNDEIDVTFHTNILLVSRIDGPKLNSTEKSTVALAAREMSINGVKLMLPPGQRHHPSYITRLNGAFIESAIFRIVALDSHGNISVHDYDLEKKEIIMVKHNLGFSDTSMPSEIWTYNEEVGIHVDGENDDGLFFVVAASYKEQIKIFWYSMTDLNLLCEYEVSSPMKNETRKIMSLRPLKACSSIDSVSVAIALKPLSESESSEIQIIQALKEESIDTDVSFNDSVMPGEDSVSIDPDLSPSATKKSKRIKYYITNPHLVYSITHEHSLKNSSIQSISLSATHLPYMIRYKITYQSTVEFKKFVPEEGEVVGRFHLFLARGRFNDADALLSSAKQLSGSYSSIHGSEVAYWRFRHLLAEDKITSKENMQKAKECLSRLSSGAVTGGSSGVQFLLNASKCLYTWPLDARFNKDECPPGPRIRDFRVALTAMSMSITNASNGVSPSYVHLLEEEEKKLKSKVLALKCIETVLQTGKQEIYLTRGPLSSVSSPGDLFSALVSNGCLNAAELVMQSNEGKCITPAVVGSAILALSSKIDPRAYIPWLKDFVIPGLSVIHPIITSIRLVLFFNL